MIRRYAKAIALIILAASLVGIVRLLASRFDEAAAPVISSDRPTETPSRPVQFIGAIIGKDHTPAAASAAESTSAPASPPASPIGLDSARMGIQAHYNFDVAGWDRTLHQIAALRVGWIKMQAAWKWLQPDAPGQFDQNFRLFQLHVQEADKRGFKVLGLSCTY